MEEGEYSNPLPPPPPPRGDSDKSSKVDSSAQKNGLSNRDFRRIVMETPRRTADAENDLPPPPSGDEDSAPAKPKADKEKRPKPKKQPKPKGNAKSKEDEEAEAGYRDRAKERREGKNEDYIGDDVFQKIHNAVQDTDKVGSLQAHDLSIATESVGALQAFRNNLTVEESKFLGGDVEHTHLVKGLDYALAQKVKRELENKSKGVQGVRDSPASTAVKDGDKIKFGSDRARAIHKIIELQANLIDHRSQMFRPGRAAYVYSLSESDGVVSELPTTLMRSKADWVDDSEEIVVAADVLVLERLVKIVNQLRLHGGKDGKGVHMSRKQKRRERELRSLDESLKQLAALKAPGVNLPGRKADGQVAVEEDDDDIFEDAGNDYVPKGSNVSWGNLGKMGFTGPANDAEDAEEGDLDNPGSSGTKRPLFGAAALPAGVNPEDVKAAESLPKKRIPRGDFEKGISGGEYDEMMPGYMDASDEEDDDDGRKAARSKDQHRDGKLGGQMSKIRKILHDKHGESYEKAFTKK